MKPVIPDYDWIIFGVRVNKPTLLTDSCIKYWGQVSMPKFLFVLGPCINSLAKDILKLLESSISNKVSNFSVK
jgi:hypothetical protein